MAESKTSEPILKEALERFEESDGATEFSRKAAQEDIEFGRLGKQWPDKIQAQREAEGRPCLTINKMPAFIRQVINDARQNKPSITVSPVDNGADEETAEVISGLIRSIERNGEGAGLAYDTAIDHAVSGGFGFFEIGIDYAHEDTFSMEARISRVPNPLMVHWDSNTTTFDSSDWEYAFVSDLLTKETFEKRYPDATAVSFEGNDRDLITHWLMDEKIRVASYWTREEKTRDLILFNGPNGPLTIREDQIVGMAKSAAQAGGLDIAGIKDDELAKFWVQLNGYEEARRRKVVYHEVTKRTISGVEVLKEEPWPGSVIPICPVWGEEVILDGKRHFRSMIRDAKDPQVMFNFWRSASTELVALAPRAPWVGPKGFIPKGHEQKWETANTRSHAYLEFEGQSAPQRTPFAGVPAGAIQEALNASDDMKAIIGIYDASLGARSNETSGRAILARQKESDVSNFHFIDNLSRAIAGAGRILVEIIPSIYTTRESVRILGEDMTQKVVKLTTEAGGGLVNPETGERDLYNLSIGKYDVEVKNGPSYSTQREETREVLIEIMRAVPAAAPILGDVLMDHMDFQGADKVSERLKYLLPPQIQAAEGIQPPPMPMQPGMPGPQIPGAPNMAQPGQPPANPQTGGPAGI